ncbi:MAG: hypothetical protein QM715_18680 [Nibricoccus sp.]
MKKTTKATTTTLATPAPSPAKKTATTAPKTPKTTAKKVAAPVATAPVVAAPAVKAAPSPKVATKIVANIDVGFGNTLYIRGEGPGLNWEKGIPLDCVADDQWSLTLSETARPVVFKFLINDLTWSIGDDYLVQPGSTAELTPVF